MEYSVQCMQALLVAIGVLLLFGVLSIFWLLPLRMKLRLQRNGFDGPPPVFPLGNLKQMSEKGEGVAPDPLAPLSHDIHSTVFPYFASWRKSYGKVFTYWLGTEPFLYIADPEFLNKVTSGALGKKWGKPNVFKHDRKPLFGTGLVMAEGDDWARHRHIIAPAFSATNLNTMLKMMVESTSKMLEDWNHQLSTSNNHQIDDVERDIIRNAAEIIAKTSFGLSQHNGKLVFEKLQAMQAMLFKTNRLVGVPFSKLLYPTQTREAQKLGNEIDQLLLAIINSRREEVASGCKQSTDLLGLLLAADQDNARIERKLTTMELVDECKTFFFGGHETTGLALTWTLFLLALYPEWQKKLREEVMDVTGGKPLDYSMLAKLTKMEWVLNEVLRLYSPAPNAQRQAREDVQVGGIVIPQGTNMWIDVVGMHHDPALWGDDVNEFKPERFKERLSGGCKHRMGFLPFGFGGRICVGRNLTAMEYKIVLCLILRKFSMSMSPEYLHSPKIMLTLRPSHGMPLILQPLDGTSK